MELLLTLWRLVKECNTPVMGEVSMEHEGNP